MTQNWEERFYEFMKDKTIGARVIGLNGLVFVDGEYQLEMGRVKSFIAKELKNERRAFLTQLLEDTRRMAPNETRYYVEDMLKRLDEPTAA